MSTDRITFGTRIAWLALAIGGISHLGSILRGPGGG
jgi:hypothetical protein